MSCCKNDTCGEAHSHGGGNWKFLATFAALCAAFGIAGTCADALGAPNSLTIALYALAIFFGSFDAVKDAFEDFSLRKFDIHFLMVAVGIGAISIGAWSEGTLLFFLFSAAEALEAFAMHRTRRAIDSLFKEQPKTATVILENGEEKMTPIESIKIGDILFVRPGEIFPVDGEILSGETAADESSITGESLPVAKNTGSAIYGGTLNLWGAARIRVTRIASESSLQKIIRLIQDAQKQKAPSQRFTDKFGTGYTMLILILTVSLFFVLWLGFSLPPFLNTPEKQSAFYRAMTLLVVASPCALVLSIPSAILAAIASGARRGILFRGGSAIEKLAEIDCVALDKTGTLTTGDLSVDRVESFPAGNENFILQTAASLEGNASHPLARAIVEHGKKSGVKNDTVSQFQNTSGFGVKGVINGTDCILGRREFLPENATATFGNSFPEIPPEHSEVWIYAGSTLGRILLRDRIRTESKPILDALSQLKIRTVMLTGDKSDTAISIGKQLGIRDIRAGLTPEEKVGAIRELNGTGHRVAMVGDGVNDAPSLAAAHVAVGMGARGSDAAIEQCDVVLMNDRIERFLEARNISVRARRVIKQNIAISLGTLVILALATIGVGIPLYIGVIAHEGSTVLVCLNSVRLLVGSPQKK